MWPLGSSRRRKLHTLTSDSALEYEKNSNDSFAWLWDWTNELWQEILGVSPDAAWCKIYDLSALAYRDSNKAAWGDFVSMAAWPSNTQNNDALYFGALHWPDEIKIGIDTPTIAGVYGGDAITWEYYNGSAWVALTILGDTSDLTGTGAQPFSQSGEVTANKPAAMAISTIDGVSAEWVRARVSTVANLTTVPIFAHANCPEFVSSAAYEDSGVTRTFETLESNVTGSLVAGVGEFACTITTSLGRKIRKVFRFVEPDVCRSDDYGV